MCDFGNGGGVVIDSRAEFEKLMKEKYPNAQMDRSERGDGYVNNAVSWAFWGFINGVDAAMKENKAP